MPTATTPFVDNRRASTESTDDKEAIPRDDAAETPEGSAAMAVEYTGWRAADLDDERERAAWIEC